MKVVKREIKKHLFVCCNEKKDDACCAKKGASDLVNSLKTRLRAEDLWGEYKVTKSGCLGPCSEGISATLYPDNLLLTQISIADENEIFKLLTDIN